VSQGDKRRFPRVKDRLSVASDSQPISGSNKVRHDGCSGGGSCSEVEACALEAPSAASSNAACLDGGGLTGWGATMALTFRAPFAAYDASQYCGVRFLAKGYGSGWSMLLSDRLSEPAGGVCFDGGEPSQACFDHLGARFQPSDAWQEFQFRFDELEAVKGYTGHARALESDALYALLFVFQDEGGADFELQVDDVAFLGPGGCYPP
jgi:endoglucanase